MKKYVGIELELELFQKGEVIMASPAVGNGDNYLGDNGELPGVGSIGELILK